MHLKALQKLNADLEISNMKILLDLNQTLVDREKDAPRIRPFELQIEQETYRQWLVELIRNEYVILITARPTKYKQATLDKIKQLTNWQPQEAYFAEIRSYPHNKKKHLIDKYLAKRLKDEEFFGIESNPKTRAIYRRYGIDSAPAITDNNERIFIDYDPISDGEERV